MYIYIRKNITICVLLAFLINSFGPMPVYAQIDLPAPGVMIEPTAAYAPAMVKGLVIDPNQPLQIDFLIDPSQITAFNKNEEYRKLAQYFLAALTVPEEDLWVNLSPYEKNRIVPDEFGKTQMGRDLLAQDYILKQLTASLIYPEKELGKTFWQKVYSQAQEQFGTTSIPINTFNKVWIVPDKAVVYEKSNGKTTTAYITESHLKIMLEQDYVALQHNRSGEFVEPEDYLAYRQAGFEKGNSDVGHQIIREIVLPAIEREVNEGKHFANLRQINNALILATWYKKRLKESILGQLYVDQNKTAGVHQQDIQDNQRIYRQYLKAFKKGVYNYIKEEPDPITHQMTPRKYFSGGYSPFFNGEPLSQRQKVVTVLTDKAMSALSQGLDRARIGLKEISSNLSTVVDVVQEKEDAIKHILDNSAPRPEPLVMKDLIEKGLTAEDIHRVAMKSGFTKLTLEKTLMEARNLIPYLIEIVEKIYEDYGKRKDYTVFFAGRDAENIYDAYMTIAAMRGWNTDRAKLFPGSMRFWERDINNGFYEDIGLTKEAIESGHQFMIIDSGFKGSIRDEVIAGIIRRYQMQDYLVTRAHNQIKIKLVSQNSYTSNPIDKPNQLIFFQGSMQETIKLFPRTVFATSSGDVANIIAITLQVMPRFHGRYASYMGSQLGYRYEHSLGNVLETKIENPNEANADVVHPYAALLVQYHLVKGLIEKYDKKSPGTFILDSAMTVEDSSSIDATQMDGTTLERSWSTVTPAETSADVQAILEAIESYNDEHNIYRASALPLNYGDEIMSRFELDLTLLNSQSDLTKIGLIRRLEQEAHKQMDFKKICIEIIIRHLNSLVKENLKNKETRVQMPIQSAQEETRDLKAWGQELRQLRADRLPLEVAQAMGISEGHLLDLELGKRDDLLLETFYKIINYYEIHPEKLINGQDIPRRFGRYEFQYFGLNVRKAIRALGTRKAFAQAIGMSTVNLRNIESGQGVFLQNAIKIAAELKTSLWQLSRRNIVFNVELQSKGIPMQEQWQHLSEKPDAELIGQNIRKKLEEKNITLNQLAQEIKVHPAYLSNILSGRDDEGVIGLENLTKIARFLDESIFYFLTGLESESEDMKGWDRRGDYERLAENMNIIKEFLGLSYKELGNAYKSINLGFTPILRGLVEFSYVSMVPFDIITASGDVLKKYLDGLAAPVESIKQWDYFSSNSEFIRRNVVRARKQSNLKIVSVEKKIKMEQGRLQKIEEGEAQATLTELLQLANVYHVNLFKLLTGKTVKNGTKNGFHPYDPREARWSFKRNYLEFLNGHSQQDLALEMGINIRILQRIKEGQMPSVDTLIKLAKAMKMPLDAFLRASEIDVEDAFQDIVEQMLGAGHLWKTSLKEEAKEILSKFLLNNQDHHKLIEQLETQGLATKENLILAYQYIIRKLKKLRLIQLRADNSYRLTPWLFNPESIILHNNDDAMISQGYVEYSLNGLTIDDLSIARQIDSPVTAILDAVEDYLKDNLELADNKLDQVKNDILRNFYLIPRDLPKERGLSGTVIANRLRQEAESQKGIQKELVILLADEIDAFAQKYREHLPEDSEIIEGDIDYPKISQRIKDLRIKNFKSASAADRQIKADGIFKQIEAGGEPSLLTLFKVANLFKVSVYTLLTGHESKVPFREYDITFIEDNLARNFVEARKRQNLRLKDMTEATGIPESELSPVENGRMPKIKKFCLMAKALGVSLDQLLRLNIYLDYDVLSIAKEEEFRHLPLRINTQDISRRIKNILDKTGETQEGFMSRINRKVDFWSMDNGVLNNLTVAMLFDIANGLKVSIFYLLTGKETSSGWQLYDYQLYEQNIGKNIQALREARGLTQPELMQMTGVSISSISKIENAERIAMLESVVVFAKALKIPIDMLVRERITDKIAKKFYLSGVDSFESLLSIKQLNGKLLQLFREKKITSAEYDLAEYLFVMTEHERKKLNGSFMIDEILKEILIEKLIKENVIRLKERTGSRDNAILMPQSNAPGGIDLNPSNLELQIKHDEKGVLLPLSQQPLNRMHIEGLSPVIMNITPVTNLPEILGLTSAVVSQ